MVRISEHSLEIVDATTLQPLVEHLHNGETWIEGKPGQEYFVRIISHQPGTYTVAYPITIDGSNIGYRFQHGPDINMTATLGAVASSSFHKVITSTTTGEAFRFTRPSLVDDADKSIHHTGCISVTWSEAFDSHIPSQILFLSSWDEQHGSAVLDSKKEGVGALKSARGSSDVNMPLATNSWDTGRQLYTATIKYCEEAGLVVRGIIQPTQASTEAASSSSRKRKKRKTEPDMHGSSPAEVVDLSHVKSEALPKSKEPCGADNVIVIDS